MATKKRLIDAKEGKKVFVALARPAEYKGVIHMVVPISEIDRLPTVDAVEVVRCEKCRYYEKAEYDEGYKMVCRLLKRQTASNGFCYCGEKK